jgi:hypothetical protein
VIYRDENDLMRLASAAAGARNLRVYRDGPGNIAYIETGATETAQFWTDRSVLGDRCPTKHDAGYPKPCRFSKMPSEAYRSSDERMKTIGTGSEGMRGAGIKTLFLTLACALASILPTAVSAQNEHVDEPAARYSCFGPPDYCVKNFARTHDRDYYDLCLLSERICRAYRYDWKMTRSTGLKDSTILSDCFPVVSVEDLLRLCKGAQGWEKDACRQNVAAARPSEADRRGESSQSWTKSHLHAACTSAASISDDEYIKNFVDWAEKHPSKRSTSLRDGLIAAAAWSCLGVKVRRGHLH